jgi:flagellar FliJ protein
MLNLQPLNILLEQAERQRDLAQADHQRAQAACRAAEAQTEQLVGYRRDYEKRWNEQFGREGKIELVRCYQSFVERLTQAVEQQRRVAAHAAERVVHAAGVLRDHEVRAASVRKLIERRTFDLRQADERREQKQTDEFASRAAWSRGNPLDQVSTH